MLHCVDCSFSGYGITTDGTTQFVNASTCTFRYQPTNPPMVFDVPNKTPDRADEQSEPWNPHWQSIIWQNEIIRTRLKALAAENTIVTPLHQVQKQCALHLSCGWMDKWMIDGHGRMDVYVTSTHTQHYDPRERGNTTTNNLPKMVRVTRLVILALGDLSLAIYRCYCQWNDTQLLSVETRRYRAGPILHSGYITAGFPIGQKSFGGTGSEVKAVEGKRGQGREKKSFFLSLPRPLPLRTLVLSKFHSEWIFPECDCLHFRLVLPKAMCSTCMEELRYPQVILPPCKIFFFQTMQHFELLRDSASHSPGNGFTSISSPSEELR